MNGEKNGLMQENSKLTRADVEQMVRRDFPAEQFESVMSLLKQIKKEPEEARINFQFNILKLSFGKIEHLRHLMPTHPETTSGESKFVNQPVPKVTRKHVERIVRRDFPTEQFSNVMSILDEYEGDSESGRTRIQMAVLKLADGKMDSLRKRIDDAKSDYRDVISWAEYPSCRWDTHSLPTDEKKKIYSKDWKQYLDWANAK
jgi:hypothetical protein